MVSAIDVDLALILPFQLNLAAHTSIPEVDLALVLSEIHCPDWEIIARKVFQTDEGSADLMGSIIDLVFLALCIHLEIGIVDKSVARGLRCRRRSVSFSLDRNSVSIRDNNRLVIGEWR